MLYLQTTCSWFKPHCPAFPMWGSPSMLTTRDMHNLVRTSQPERLILWERDIDNAFWELDKDTVIEGINTAVHVVRA